MKTSKNKPSLKHRLHEIIYEADTKQGKIFDVVLLILILASIALVMLESIGSIDAKFHDIFYIGEWIITLFFTLEYIARIITVKKPSKYIFSFYGILCGSGMYAKRLTGLQFVRGRTRRSDTILGYYRRRACGFA